MASIGRVRVACQSPVRRLEPTFGQRRLWTLARLHPGDPAYHQLSVIRLDGPLDRQALRTALAHTVERHASLRARFPAEADLPICVIDAHSDVPLRTFDLSSLSPQSRERAIKTAATREARKPFDLANGPLF